MVVVRERVPATIDGNKGMKSESIVMLSLWTPVLIARL